MDLIFLFNILVLLLSKSVLSTCHTQVPTRSWTTLAKAKVGITVKTVLSIIWGNVSVLDYIY